MSEVVGVGTGVEPESTLVVVESAEVLGNASGWMESNAAFTDSAQVVG